MVALHVLQVEIISSNKGKEKPKVEVISRSDIEPVPKEVPVIRERVFTIGANLGYGFVFNQASIGANAQVYLADYLAGDVLFNYFATQRTDETKIPHLLCEMISLQMKGRVGCH